MNFIRIGERYSIANVIECVKFSLPFMKAQKKNKDTSWCDTNTHCLK